jgi:hypothetical protein
MQGAGFADVKPLHVTGGMSFELGKPRCKPQVQKTGTIYMPFCADPTAVRLEILKIILPFAGVFERRHILCRTRMCACISACIECMHALHALHAPIHRTHFACLLYCN